jgi:L-lactate dehydrogenase (cytochrome)
VTKIAAHAELSWDHVRLIRRLWKGPFVIKGILSRADARIARDHGADGIIVSNHGGRQLDKAASPLHVLPGIVAEAGGMTVMIDGGFRRGTDIVKALALGARAVLIGRPYIYGLAVAGEAGVTSVLDLLRTEIDQTLALLGVGAVRDLDSSYVQVLPGFGCARARSEVEYETPA